MPHGLEFTCPQQVTILVIKENQITFRKNTRFNMFVILSLDTFSSGFLLLTQHHDESHLIALNTRDVLLRLWCWGEVRQLVSEMDFTFNRQNGFDTIH
jgi:16S rRNA U516 pseudouridylate synthase RsuA-like enzyme